jgi:hypothetical protein
MLRRASLLVTLLAACGGGASQPRSPTTPTTQPPPPAPRHALTDHDLGKPARPPADDKQPDQVAIAGNPCGGGEIAGNPCDGGEIAGKGLGLAGAGAGGGGSGATTGVGNLGTIGHGSGSGSGSGYGAGPGGGIGGKPSPIAVTLGALEVKGPLAPEVIGRVLRRRLNALRLCYERALHLDPGAAPAVTRIKLAVGPKGDVVSAQSDLPGELGACVVAQVRRMEFPQADQVTLVGLPVTLSQRR